MLKLFKKTTYEDDEITLVLKRVYPAERDLGIRKTYRFDIVLNEDNVRVGYIDLRVGDSEYLYYMGNIGYRIEEKYRGHHYASKAVRLVLKQARKDEMERVIITCSPDNTASYKTITRVRAKLIGTCSVPEWHELYQRGEDTKCIFEIDFKKHRYED